MTIAEVLREMRAGLLPKKAWADAIEAAMREPVAEVVPVIISRRERYTEIRPKGKAATVPGTKLFTFPPDQRAEIEMLREENLHVHNLLAEARAKNDKAPAEYEALRTRNEDLQSRLARAETLAESLNALLRDQETLAKRWLDRLNNTDVELTTCQEDRHIAERRLENLQESYAELRKLLSRAYGHTADAYDLLSEGIKTTLVEKEDK